MIITDPKMNEYIIEFDSVKFLVSASTRTELDTKVAVKINHHAPFGVDVARVKLQQYHPKFSTYYDIEDGDMPNEGVLLAAM